MKVAVCVRPDRPAARATASDAIARIRAGGHEVTELTLDGPDVARAAEGSEVICVFGGDGTMLRAARVLAPLGIPLLGVNLGRLGFLTIVSLGEFDETFAHVAAGRYRSDDRAMVAASLERDGRAIVGGLALNDVVVARGAEVRSIRIDVLVDGEPFTQYWADGLIVATATGSTAYGFSVGGPIVLPDSPDILFVPIAPHLSFQNAVVIAGDQRLRLDVLDAPARLSLDGQEEHDLRPGDRISVRRSETVARLVRTPNMRPFLSLLKQKILKEGQGI